MERESYKYSFKIFRRVRIDKLPLLSTFIPNYITKRKHSNTMRQRISKEIYIYIYIRKEKDVTTFLVDE